MHFQELRLIEPILHAVASEGYTRPTPIQVKAIPPILDGADVLGCAQTGTGKTGAFALPMLQRLAGPDGGKHQRLARGRRPRALVLCPTRELATQIFESFNTYGQNLAMQHAVVFGGVNQSSQVKSIRAGTDVLVATPGRLLDLMNQRIIDLRDVEILVLDEADHMLDMGFIRDIRRIVEHVPTKRQTLLFSATMPEPIRRLADTVLCDPVSVEAARISSPVESIAQSVYHVTRQNKPELLQRLLDQDGIGRTLIFTRTKHGADRLVRRLKRDGIEAGAIHGNKSQNARTRALDGFKSGVMPVLIATDIAARGIDVDEVTHVVNYDLPNVPETYVHRIGRTARAGASGSAMSFCDHEELEHLHAIERLIDRTLNVSRDESDLLHDAPTQRGRASTGRRDASGGGTRTNGESGGNSRRRRRRRPSSGAPRASHG